MLKERHKWSDNAQSVLAVLADCARDDLACLLDPGPFDMAEDVTEVCAGLARVLKEIGSQRFAIILEAWVFPIEGAPPEVEPVDDPNLREVVCLMAGDTRGGRAAGEFAVEGDERRLGAWEMHKVFVEGTLDAMIFDMVTRGDQPRAVH